MKDKCEPFIIERRKPGVQTGDWPVVRISEEAYLALARMATEAKQPLSKLASKAIIYAEAHAAYVDPE